MIPMLALVAWAMVLGTSPGLALIAVALTVLFVDRFDPAILDRLLGRADG